MAAQRRREHGEAEAQAQHHGQRPQPEDRHHHRARCCTARPRRRHHEGVEPSTRQQSGEQADRERARGRRPRGHALDALAHESADRRRHRAGGSRTPAALEQRGHTPEDDQHPCHRRSRALNSEEAARGVERGTERAGQRAQARIGGEPAEVVGEMTGEPGSLPAAIGVAGIEGDEAAAHAGTVEAAEQAGGEHGQRERGHGRPARSWLMVRVKTCSPRVTRTRSSHNPGRPSGRPAA